MERLKEVEKEVRGREGERKVLSGGRKGMTEGEKGGGGTRRRGRRKTDWQR